MMTRALAAIWRFVKDDRSMLILSGFCIGSGLIGLSWAVARSDGGDIGWSLFQIAYGVFVGRVFWHSAGAAQ